MNFPRFSFKCVYLFPVWISPPCTVDSFLFSSVLCAACHIRTVNVVKDWRKHLVPVCMLRGPSVVLLSAGAFQALQTRSCSWAEYAGQRAMELLVGRA